MTTEQTIKEMAEAFLRWPLPESVCADPCATKQGTGRVGTSLLSYVEAEQMITAVVGPTLTALRARLAEVELELARVKANDERQFRILEDCKKQLLLSDQSHSLLPERIAVLQACLLSEKRAKIERGDMLVEAERERDEARAELASLHRTFAGNVHLENKQLRADLAETEQLLQMQTNHVLAARKLLSEKANELPLEGAVAHDLAAAREDTARLDWLEQHRNAGIGATATKRIAGLSRTLEDFRDYEWKGDTVRAAIDAARAGGAK